MPANVGFRASAQLAHPRAVVHVQHPARRPRAHAGRHDPTMKDDSDPSPAVVARRWCEGAELIRSIGRYNAVLSGGARGYVGWWATAKLFQRAAHRVVHGEVGWWPPVAASSSEGQRGRRQSTVKSGGMKLETPFRSRRRRGRFRWLSADGMSSTLRLPAAPDLVAADEDFSQEKSPGGDFSAQRRATFPRHRPQRLGTVKPS